MSKNKRRTSYAILILFGFLFLKNLLPEMARQSQSNHEEIGHIHFYQVISKLASTVTYSFDSKRSSGHHENKNCSSGKSVFTYISVPSGIFVILIPSLGSAFDLILNLHDNFQTPYLEPRRKPPRLA